MADLGLIELWRFAVAMFAQVVAPAQLRHLEQIVSDWRPDLVVHVPTALGAPVAAVTAGLPSVTQGFGLLPRAEMLAAMAAASAPLWQSRGLEPEPGAGVFGALYLNPVPHSLEPDAEARVNRQTRMRLDMPVPSDSSLPDWAVEQGARPLIYVGLGTVPPFSQPALFASILQGLSQHDLEVVVTVGEQNDVSSLGPQPSNVHAVRWLPLPLLLPRCTAAICHAGSGTMLAALGAGLPLLLLPQGADQFQNAAACARAGVARILAPNAFSAEAVATEIGTLLTDPLYRGAAQRIRAELGGMPSPAEVAPRLQELVRSDSSARADDGAQRVARPILTREK